jgi:hypothetical protein
METDDCPVDLPLTAAAWEEGSEIDDLERALEEDLEPLLSDLAESACESGGWPEDETVEASVVSVDDGEIRAEVTIYFTEVIASSCKDMPHHEKRDSRRRIVLRAGELVGYAEYSLSDTSQWDLRDRNSAADGA